MFKQLNTMKNILSSAIEKVFNRDHLNEIARRTGFVKRSSSKIEGFEIPGALTGETVNDPYISYEGLCGEIVELNPDADITPQALEQRINSPECVNYLKTVLEESLEEKISGINLQDPVLLQPFGHVYIEDSTTITLHEKLADEFKGSGGSASTAAIKVDCIYELKNPRIARLEIREGTDPDQSMAGAANEIMQPGDLKITDLGYFSIPEMKETDGSDKFYLSRMIKTANVYLNKEDSEPLNLPEYLDKNFAGTAVIDLEVYIGKEERLKTRLTIYRLKQEIVSVRRRKARENAKKKGRTPTKEYMAWLEFSFFVTNVPPDVWSAEVIGTIYRVRWQIELIFKNWKSLLNIHVLKGFRPERIKCLIYGKLITAVLMTLIYRYAAGAVYFLYEREVSFFKLTGWLKRSIRLRKLFSEPEMILKAVDKELPRLKKQKRKRKTTAGLIQTETGYLETLEERIQEAEKMTKRDIKNVITP